MIPTWTTLGGDDRAAFWAVVDFLKRRLTESDTIEWALHLRPDQRIERMAISHLLDSTTGPVLEELQKDPWATAWRLIQESWSQASIDEHDSPHLFDIGLRLHVGDRSGPNRDRYRESRCSSPEGRTDRFLHVDIHQEAASSEEGRASSIREPDKRTPSGPEPFAALGTHGRILPCHLGECA